MSVRVLCVAFFVLASIGCRVRSETKASALNQSSAPLVTAVEPAPIDSRSLVCSVSATTRENDSFRATLRIDGVSLEPRVMDQVTGEWRNIQREPLYVYPPVSAGEQSGTVEVLVFHRQYLQPEITDIGHGDAAIGSVEDVPFR